MLQTLRERLVLILIALLPLHAFLVTVATKLIAGPGNAPLAFLALWKETVLGVVLVIALLEVVKRAARSGQRVASFLRIDWIDACIVSLLILSILLALGDYSLLATRYSLGFKYDFVPLVAFFVLRRVSWSDAFQEQIVTVLLAVGWIVAGYGIVSFFLPQSFFTALGYSDLHSLYLPDGPLAAYQQIGSSALRRIQSTMSGPNQLGLWLLLPWSVALLKKQWPLAVVIAIALILTFSRTAWIAAGVILLLALFFTGDRARFKRAVFRLVVGGIAVLLIAGFLAPQLLLRAASTGDHLRKPLIALQSMVEHPLGQGLGTAGPASNRVSDACVFLEEGADTSWAADRSDLCVFTGDTQVQPTDRACQCPFVTENWYLQIGVELGWIGMALFLTLIILLLFRLRSAPQALLPLVGVSVAGLFLHAFEDAAVAYTVWLLVAVLL